MRQGEATGGAGGKQSPGVMSASPFEKASAPASLGVGVGGKRRPRSEGRSIAGGNPRPRRALPEDIEEDQSPPSSRAARVLGEAEPHGLAATYSFDTRGWTTTGPLVIGFVGTRLDGGDGTADRFERIERLAELGPATGKVTLTLRRGGVAPGRWRIVAGPVENPGGHPVARKTIVTSTQFALMAHGPGVRLFAWPGLIGLGALLALVLQVLLASRASLPVFPVLALSVAGCLLGFLGGKTWWLAVNRRPVRAFFVAGACIQGFLLTALLILGAGVHFLGISPGGVLDVTAPGIYLGMAAGRPGCFLAGCCAGRPTTSRWGIWSTDRRLGILRVPVQLYEAAIALLIGVGALALVLAVTPPFPGALFLGATATYTLARQFLFRLRTNSHTRLGRWVVKASSGLILLGVLIAYLGS